MKQDSKPDKYKTAVKFNRKAKKKAYGAYQRKIKSKLNRMPCSDGAFCKLAEEIGGLEPSRSEAAPSAQDLADHFADKLTNGKDIEADEYTPKDSLKVPLCSFRIRFKKVRGVLRKMDPNKSANGVAPRMMSSPQVCVVCLNTSSRKRNTCCVGRQGEFLLPTSEV